MKVSLLVDKVVSRQSFCKNNQAYFLAHLVYE